jgi:hypothetical protein
MNDRHAHQDEIQKSKQRYRHDHQDEIQKSKQRYSHDHQDEMQKSKKRYRQANSQNIQEYNRRNYQNKNPTFSREGEEANSSCTPLDDLAMFNRFLNDENYNNICNRLINQVFTSSRATIVNDTVERQRSCVCVVCDQIIFTIEPKKRITKERLMGNSNRLCVSQYEEHFGIQLHPLLIEQYQVVDDDLKHLLLSPRSKCHKGTYQCCQSCYTSLTSSRNEEISTPPKFEIANGFAIGHIPEILTFTDRSGESVTRTIDIENNLDEKICVAIAPVCPYGFVHAFTGGSQKSITGHFLFFSVN